MAQLNIDDKRINATAIKVVVSALMTVAVHALSGGSIEPLWAALAGVGMMTLLSIHQIIDGIKRIMFSLEALFANEKEIQNQLTELATSLEMKLAETVKEAVESAMAEKSINVTKLEASIEQVSNLIKEQSVLELPTMDKLRELLAAKERVENEDEPKQNEKAVKFDFSNIHKITKKKKK